MVWYTVVVQCFFFMPTVHVNIFCNHSRYNREEVVRYLVSEVQCSPNVQDKDGETPLHYACR